MLKIHNISVSYAKKTLFSDVSLTFKRGALYGIYGPSGCGKTTFARILAGLQKPSTGIITINEKKFSSLKHWPVQYLFQNPLHAMNSRWKIKKILKESGPLDPVHTKRLGIVDEWMERFPHELSNGQLQRISILRALGANPDYLIADEITAALDPIAQAQIWHFLEHLAYEHDMALLAISHDRELLNRLTPAENCIDFSTL